MFVRAVLRSTTFPLRENSRLFSYARCFSSLITCDSGSLFLNNLTRLPIQPKQPATNFSTSAEGGVFTKLKRILGFGKLPKSVTRAIGYQLYDSIELQVNHIKFLEGLQMPDTFHSWFVVRALHVWMLMVRLMQEGEEGRLVRNALVEAMWEDVDFKSKQLGELASSVRKKQIQELVSEFQASLFSYDEGLLTSDVVLAGAIWRHIFGQEDFNVKHLSLLVDYIRHNISYLDSLNYEHLIDKRSVQWAQLMCN